MQLIVTKGLKQAKKQRGIDEWEAGKPHEGPADPTPGGIERAMEKGQLARETRSGRSMAGKAPSDGKTYSVRSGTGDVGTKEHASGLSYNQAQRLEAKASARNPGKTFSTHGDKDVVSATKVQKSAIDSMISKAKECMDKADMGTLKQGPGGKMEYSGAPAEKLGIAGKKPGTVGDTHFEQGPPAAKKQVATGGAKPPPVPSDAKSMTKAATEILKGPANDAKEPGPVQGFNMGGKDRASTSCQDDTGEEHHGGAGAAQESVSGFPQAGSGPAQTSVSGTPHAGSGPAQTSVAGKANPANLSKAVTSMAMPRMPRAMAMAMDTWRSATRVLNRDSIEKHAGVGPLNGETIQAVEEASHDRATRPEADVIKACNSCGRTYTLRKGMNDACPSCSMNKSVHCSCGMRLVKSHGGFSVCPIHG